MGLGLQEGVGLGAGITRTMPRADPNQIDNLTLIWIHSMLPICHPRVTYCLYLQDLRINSTTNIGHVLGGASGVEAVATVKTVQTGRVSASPALSEVVADHPYIKNKFCFVC